MNKKHIIGFCALACALVLFTSGCAKEKTIVTDNPIYPQFTMETISETAVTIVRGTVIERGETFLVDIDNSLGEVTQRAFTPLTISVTSSLKGDNTIETAIYNERGGETETTIYQTDEIKLDISDEVLVFLNEVGVSWGAQGIYKINDGKVTVLGNMLPATLYSADEPTIMAEIPITEFEALISGYLNSRLLSSTGLA